MGEVSGVLDILKAGWTPGGVGIWFLVVMAGVGWWKGLPSMLDAWTRRADANEARIGKEFGRLEAQIVSGERRHAECEARCERQQGELERLNKVIDGLIRQMRQLQISAVRVGMNEAPTVTSKLLAELDRIPDGDLTA